MTDKNKIEMREIYANTVEHLYKNDDNVYALEADLSNAMSTKKLKDIMGKNYVDLGIMEANMIGVASGINLAGGYAFVHSFGQFLTRRAMDQIFISLAYSNLSACLVGSDSGVTAEHNGGTHMSFEDMAILRVIPNINIYDVCDPIEFEYVLKKAYKQKQLAYIRTARKQPEINIYGANEKFEDDKGAKVLKTGSDVSLLACGIEVGEAVKASEKLRQKGIDAEVIDVYRIKPLDENTILQSAKKTKKIVTCENHSIIGALGSAVAELLSEKEPTQLKRVGIKDKFGQVGQIDYLKKEYRISCDDIVNAALEIL